MPADARTERTDLMVDTDGQVSRTQTTRFQYPRGDKVIADFFTTNVYKSAALIDVIYLFRLDYGPDADVSQILRDKLMAARSDVAQHDSAASNNVYTSGAPGSDDAASSEDAADDTTAGTAQPEPQPKQTKPKSKQQQKQSKPKSKSTAEQSDFNIAEMFD